MVTTIKTHDIVIFQGSGTVDGPTKIGSSTRSKLGGFTAPILLAAAIARHWALRHRWKFRWYTDSTSAISTVKIYTTQNELKLKYPANSDYITTIPPTSTLVRTWNNSIHHMILLELNAVIKDNLATNTRMLAAVQYWERRMLLWEFARFRLLSTMERKSLLWPHTWFLLALIAAELDSSVAIFWKVARSTMVELCKSQTCVVIQKVQSWRGRINKTGAAVKQS